MASKSLKTQAETSPRAKSGEEEALFAPLPTISLLPQLTHLHKLLNRPRRAVELASPLSLLNSVYVVIQYVYVPIQ